MRGSLSRVASTEVAKAVDSPKPEVQHTVNQFENDMRTKGDSVAAAAKIVKKVSEYCSCQACNS